MRRRDGDPFFARRSGFDAVDLYPQMQDESFARFRFRPEIRQIPEKPDERFPFRFQPVAGRYLLVTVFFAGRVFVIVDHEPFGRVGEQIRPGGKDTTKGGAPSFVITVGPQ
jgi:hypothetical protein